MIRVLIRKIKNKKLCSHCSRILTTFCCIVQLVHPTIFQLADPSFIQLVHPLVHPVGKLLWLQRFLSHSVATLVTEFGVLHPKQSGAARRDILQNTSSFPLSLKANREREIHCSVAWFENSSASGSPCTKQTKGPLQIENPSFRLTSDSLTVKSCPNPPGNKDHFPTCRSSS